MKKKDKNISLLNIEVFYAVLLSCINSEDDNAEGDIDFRWLLYFFEKLEVDIYKEISFLLSYIEDKWVEISIKKSKRKITRKNKDIWKREVISKWNYTGQNLKDILTKDFDDYVSLETHDFFISDLDLFEKEISNEIEFSMDEFVSWEKDIWGVTFEKAKKLLYRRILSVVEMSVFENDEYSFDDEYSNSIQVFIGAFMFWEDIFFPFMHMILIFQRLWYIKCEKGFLSDPYCYDENKILGGFCEVTEQLQNIINTHLLIDEYILDTIFNKKYKDLKLKGGENHILLERTIEHHADEDMNFVKIQKQYPHSEITAKNYKGKVQKYIVKEKKKFESSE